MDYKNTELLLLKNIYNIWIINNPNIIKNNNKFFLFKDFILKTYKNCDKLIKYIDIQIRYNYLLKKYFKKWITIHINKKRPLNIQDLQFNIIDPKNYYINYIDYIERRRYLFSEYDFKKLVSSYLHNSYEYDIEPDPLPIKNPYTNKVFTKTELRMFNNSVRDMPISWIMFYDCDFDIEKLKLKYYENLLELCIPNYVDKLNDLDIIDYIIDIFIYSNDLYCGRCILEKKDINTLKVRKALIKWIFFLKLKTDIPQREIENIRNIYGKNTCYHNKNISNNILNILNIFEITLDFSKPLFCEGYKLKQDRKNYFKRIKEKILRNRFKIKKKI
jgi:hypothetical protein